MFFQWRAAQAGAEKFHSALVPHAGTDSQIYRDTMGLGQALKRLAPVAGSRVQARAAMIWDYQAWWAAELDSHPSVDVTYTDRARALHAALWRRGITVDMVRPEDDLDGYDLIVVPTLYLVSDAGAANLADAAARGATVAITYFSGIVDLDDRVRLGGYPGAFRDLLGVRTDEFFPLLVDEQVTLDDGSLADTWTERIELNGAQVVRRFVDGPMAGGAAITRLAVGTGAAWYIATRQDEAGTAALVDALIAESGVVPVAEVPEGVEAVERVGVGGHFLFAINHGHDEAVVPVSGIDLLTGSQADSLLLAGGGCAVVQLNAP